MTNEEASIIVGNIPINGDGCYSIPEYQEAKAMAIETLDQQPFEDAVSRQAVLDTLDKMDKALDTDRTVENYKDLLTECYKDLPPVTPKEKTGHWEYVQYDGNPNIGNLHCSECERIAGFEYNFCPNCGARMVSE